MKVGLVGDTHMNVKFAKRVTEYARNQQIDTLIQLGDFGYTFDQTFIQVWTNWLMEDDNRMMFWLDGNHDDHDYIEDEILGYPWHELYEAEDPIIDHPVAHWHEHMFYCPRGSVTQLGDTVVQFLGGAYSIDKQHRLARGAKWWPQEMITPEQRDFACSNSFGVRLLLAHDCPDTVWFKDRLNEGEYKVDADSQRNRDLVSSVVARVRPKMVVHGHYHARYSTTLTLPDGWEVRVEGLDCDHRRLPNNKTLTEHVIVGHNFHIIEL